MRAGRRGTLGIPDLRRRADAGLVSWLAWSLRPRLNSPVSVVGSVYGPIVDLVHIDLVDFNDVQIVVV
jgi:hypothetical protein